ncbi:Receptor-like protein kinase [Melia azedarach]|uniref:Receptor-like protein kinase n=1 Tax=Melia azedarach TaxID=155640 RepID=A0ACC1XPM0_MELAZ|nr:Receptor-like protein kinase [Melia azedarach]
MNIHLCPSLALHSILTILCVLIAIPSSYCDEDEKYTTCNRSYSCGQIDRPGIFHDFREIIIDRNLFNYSPNVRVLSLYYNCGDKLSQEGKNDISCPTEPEKITGFYTIDGNSLLPNRSKSCNRVIKVPFLQTDEPSFNTTNDLLAGKWNDVLRRGFEVEYRTYNEACSQCVSSSGICGSNPSNLEQFACLCRDKPHMNTCDNPGMLPPLST